jgi:hypothetical protein
VFLVGCVQSLKSAFIFSHWFWLILVSLIYQAFSFSKVSGKLRSVKLSRFQWQGYFLESQVFKNPRSVLSASVWLGQRFGKS